MNNQVTKRYLRCFMMSMMVLCAGAWAGPSFFDDFRDGDVNDGSPVSWGWDDDDAGERVITADGFSMRPNPGGFPWAAVLDESDEGAVYAGNASIRAQFKMDNPVGDAFAGIIFRGDDSGNYYSVGIGYGKLFLCGITNHQWENWGWYRIQGYDWGRDEIIIEVDVIDITESQGQPASRLEVRAWLLDQAKPTQAQISRVDSKYDEGMTFIYSYGRPATFRWVQVISEATGPIVDFNGDGKVDIKDLLKMINNWNQDEPSVDINGDGMVDDKDLEILMEHWDQEIDDPTLLAHWALDETEGLTAYDSAGTNDAVLSGDPVWQPTMGQLDGALELDGDEDCIITGPVLNPADGPFSVIAWVKGGAAGQVVVSESSSNWLCTDPSNGELTTELACQGQSSIPLLSETVIADGEWHRIGLVWDGSNRALYVDDIIVAQDTQDGLKASNSGLYIGTGKAMEAGTFWSGLIDDIRIYNRAVRP